MRANDTYGKGLDYIKVFGRKEWSFAGQLPTGGANAVLLNPMSLPGVLKAGIVEIAAWSDDGTISEGGSFLVTGSGASKLSGTANCALYVAGKIGVWWQSRSNVSVANGLAQTLNVMVRCTWHDDR